MDSYGDDRLLGGLEDCLLLFEEGVIVFPMLGQGKGFLDPAVEVALREEPGCLVPGRSWVIFCQGLVPFIYIFPGICKRPVLPCTQRKNVFFFLLRCVSVDSPSDNKTHTRSSHDQLRKQISFYLKGLSRCSSYRSPPISSIIFLASCSFSFFKGSESVRAW